MLALECALTLPEGLASLTLVGTTPAAVLVWEARDRSYERLPPDVRETLLRHETTRTFEGPEYERAVRVFYRRHVLRSDERPGWWSRVLDRFNTRLNVHMWEPNGGELSQWDVRPRLREIRVPTLIMAGRHDGASAGSEDALYKGIASSKLAIFEDSSHYPFAEEPELFIATLEDFLTRAEKG